MESPVVEVLVDRDLVDPILPSEAWVTPSRPDDDVLLPAIGWPKPAATPTPIEPVSSAPPVPSAGPGRAQPNRGDVHEPPPIPVRSRRPIGVPATETDDLRIGRATSIRPTASRRAKRGRPGGRGPAKVTVLILATLAAAGLGAWAVATARSPESSRPSDSKAFGKKPSGPTAKIEGQRIVATADGLTAADGPRATELAKRLRSLADLEPPELGIEAGALSGKVTAWTGEGGITASAAAPVQATLATVAGFVLPEASTSDNPSEGGRDKPKTKDGDTNPNDVTADPKATTANP